MLLGIFDIFHVEEFHGHITDWWAIIVTAILSGGVAFFAAWLQIWFQKRNQKRIKEEKKNATRRIVYETICDFLKQVEYFLEQLEKGVENSNLDSNNFDSKIVIDNTTFVIIDGIGYFDYFESFSKWTKQKNNVEVIQNYFSSVRQLSSNADLLNNYVDGFLNVFNKLNTEYNNINLDYCHREIHYTECESSDKLNKLKDLINSSSTDLNTLGGKKRFFVKIKNFLKDNPTLQKKFSRYDNVLTRVLGIYKSFENIFNLKKKTYENYLKSTRKLKENAEKMKTLLEEIERN